MVAMEQRKQENNWRKIPMFKNCVFKVSVDTKKWFKSASIRAIKTIAQTAVATIGVSTAMGTVDWKMVLSASALSGVISILTSISGLPEVESKE